MNIEMKRLADFSRDRKIVPRETSVMYQPGRTTFEAPATTNTQRGTPREGLKEQAAKKHYEELWHYRFFNDAQRGSDATFPPIIAHTAKAFWYQFSPQRRIPQDRLYPIRNRIHTHGIHQHGGIPGYLCHGSSI
jgi:hypothetical protein